MTNCNLGADEQDSSVSYEDLGHSSVDEGLSDCRRGHTSIFFFFLSSTNPIAACKCLHVSFVPRSNRGKFIAQGYQLSEDTWLALLEYRWSCHGEASSPFANVCQETKVQRDVDVHLIIKKRSVNNVFSIAFKLAP